MRHSSSRNLDNITVGSLVQSHSVIPFGLLHLGAVGLTSFALLGDDAVLERWGRILLDDDLIVVAVLLGGGLVILILLLLSTLVAGSAAAGVVAAACLGTGS